jgi:hypothetical protein
MMVAGDPRLDRPDSALQSGLRWGSRRAAIGLAVVGALVLARALLVDLPVTSETGAIGLNFEGATAASGPVLTLELVAGGLGLVAPLAPP